MKNIVIIGGGASGLAAAASLNNMKDLQVTLLEANKDVGKKILASGNGRCNLSHINIKIEDYHHTDSFDLHPILDSYTYQSFFDNQGLWTKVEGDLVYPNSKQSSSVVQFLKNHMNHIEVKLNTKALYIDPNLQIVYTNNGEYPYDYLIMCNGSKASKSVGGSESGYEMLKGIGHHITNLQPALVQMRSHDVPKYLKGTRIRGVFSLLRGNKIIQKETGELLFTDYGLSGIAIFQLSRLYQKGDSISVDVFPDQSVRELTNRIKAMIAKHNFDLEVILPYQYGKYLKSITGEIRFNNIDQIVRLLKDAHFKIDSLNDFENAQITRGGLRLSEVNPDLSSKKYPNIFIAGELLDVDGPCGGYNLHFAFASGYYIASNIMKGESHE